MVDNLKQILNFFKGIPERITNLKEEWQKYGKRREYPMETWLVLLFGSRSKDD